MKIFGYRRFGAENSRTRATRPRRSDSPVKLRVKEGRNIRLNCSETEIHSKKFGGATSKKLSPGSSGTKTAPFARASSKARKRASIFQERRVVLHVEPHSTRTHRGQMYFEYVVRVLDRACSTRGASRASSRKRCFASRQQQTHCAATAALEEARKGR